MLHARRSVVQRVKYRIPQEFKNQVSTTIAGRFGVPQQALSVREHDNSDFAVSAFLQIAHIGEIEHVHLPLEVHGVNPSRKELADFRRAAVGTNGLTVEDGRGGRIIHVLQSPNENATLIHEAMHAHSSATFGIFFGKDVDEGMTEYFAREVMAAIEQDPRNYGKGLNLTATRGKVYTHEVALASVLIAELGVQTVRDAYFRGAVAPIRANLPVDGAANNLRAAWTTFRNGGGGAGALPEFWRILTPPPVVLPLAVPPPVVVAPVGGGPAPGGGIAPGGGVHAGAGAATGSTPWYRNPYVESALTIAGLAILGAGGAYFAQMKPAPGSSGQSSVGGPQAGRRS
jgi:hypothetical protein